MSTHRGKALLLHASFAQTWTLPFIQHPGLGIIQRKSHRKPVGYFSKAKDIFLAWGHVTLTAIAADDHFANL